MGAKGTRMVANMAVDYMESINFVPKTLLNIGVGSCPELSVWRNRIPNVALLGVDLRHGRWNAPYIEAVVSDEDNKDIKFCWRCKSVHCQDITHSRKQFKPSQVRTIDSIVEETKAIPPFFMWMDIEGSEMEALNGAKNTLLQTPIINIEIREWNGTVNRCEDLHNLLVAKGYALVDVTAINPNNYIFEDKLYRRVL